jgi:hypothetical protein
MSKQFTDNTDNMVKEISSFCQQITKQADPKGKIEGVLTGITLPAIIIALNDAGAGAWRYWDAGVI